MEISFVPVNTPKFWGEELIYVNECLKTGWISSSGSYVEKFENQFSEYIGTKYCCTVTNGTTAIEIVLRALNLKVGDEIAISNFTIFSCLSEILRLGLKPIFIDCNDLCNADFKDFESKVSKKTKAAILAHTYCFPLDIDPFIDLCKSLGIILIEDAAEMHGQLYKNKKCGSFGDISVFSFYANKIITMGEGGAILTNNLEFHEKFKLIRNLAFSPDRYVHYELGTNARLTNIQCAIGLGQLENIEKSIKRKREIGRNYNDMLKDMPWIDLMPEETNYSNNIYWVYPIKVLSKKEEIILELKEEGVDTRSFFYPLDAQPVLKKFGFDLNLSSNSMSLFKRGLYIPSGIGMTDQEQDFVINKLKKVGEKLF